MNPWKYALRSFVHYWRTNLAVALGAAVGTAVLTGALLVGDSVRNSLLDLSIERLGRIDSILLAHHFFSSDLVETIHQEPGFRQHFDNAIPAILLTQASAEFSAAEGTHRTSNVNLIGCTHAFWGADPG